MAIYKTTSSKSIIRKVFRDINPNNDNWIDDAIEWIGEALEHIGASTQLEKKVCVLPIVDYKAVLPADLYYVNQVAVNNAVAPSVETELDELLSQTNEILGLLESNPDQDLTYQMRELNSRIVVLENIYMNNETLLTPLQYCTTNFPRGIHCDKCVNEFTTSNECYLVENDRIKTSFRTGKLCLSYTAFATDTECWPLIPDDISFKEAMFWYIYKKLLLGASFDPSTNGIDYSFADQQWKFYCTQARNEAKYPDMARYESFMNQWVRLVPRISEFDNVMGTLNTRENLYRGNYSTNSIA